MARLQADEGAEPDPDAAHPARVLPLLRHLKTSPTLRLTRDRAAIFAGAVAAFLALPVFVRPFAFAPDDGLFYLQVAHNLATRGWSTFNGITSTNGYHPLWMVANALAAALVGGARGPLLYVVLAVESLVLAATALAFVRGLRARGLEGIVGCAVLLALFATSFWTTEAHLAALFAWLAVTEERSPTLRGLLLGLAVLARLDSALMVPLFGAAIVVTESRPGAPARAGIAVGVAIAVVVPYCVFNAVVYGHVVPISGAIKSSFPHLHPHLSALGDLQKWVCVFAAVGLALAPTRGARAIRLPLTVLGGQTLLQAGYIVLFTNHAGTAASWYASIGCLNAALVVEAAWAALPPRVASRRYGLALASLLATASLARGWLKVEGVNVSPLHSPRLSRIEPPNGIGFEESIARWMNANLPPGSRLLVTDFPGILAYRTDVAILPMDGLMADYAYDQALATRGVAATLARDGVGYFLGPIPREGNDGATSWMAFASDGTRLRVTALAPLERSDAGTFVVTMGDLLVDSAALAPGDTEHLRVGVYRLPPELPLP